MRNKMFRFPLDAWDKWYGRKKKIEERIKIATNKNKKVHMTDVLRFYGQKQLYIFDEEVVSFFTRKRRRKINNGGMI